VSLIGCQPHNGLSPTGSIPVCLVREAARIKADHLLIDLQQGIFSGLLATVISCRHGQTMNTNKHSNVCTTAQLLLPLDAPRCADTSSLCATSSKRRACSSTLAAMWRVHWTWWGTWSSSTATGEVRRLVLPVSHLYWIAVCCVSPGLVGYVEFQHSYM
jgi:hypothetical protein